MNISRAPPPETNDNKAPERNQRFGSWKMILSFWILLGQKGANFQGPFAAFGIGSSFRPLPSLPRTNSHFAPEDEGEMGPKIFHYS